MLEFRERNILLTWTLGCGVVVTLYRPFLNILKHNFELPINRLKQICGNISNDKKLYIYY